MGVSGTGKSTVGRALADHFGLDFIEGDDHHPEANIKKMSAGISLEDSDRWPWLAELGSILGRPDEAPVVLTCSALKRSYRDLLRRDVAGGEPCFVHLAASRAVLLPRMAGRDRHFMPTMLLDSQLATLEPLGVDECGFVVDVTGPPEEVIATAIAGVLD